MIFPNLLNPETATKRCGHRARIFWKWFEGSADPARLKVHPSLTYTGSRRHHMGTFLLILGLFFVVDCPFVQPTLVLGGSGSVDFNSTTVTLPWHVVSSIPQHSGFGHRAGADPGCPPPRHGHANYYFWPRVDEIRPFGGNSVLRTIISNRQP